MHQDVSGADTHSSTGAVSDLIFRFPIVEHNTSSHSDVEGQASPKKRKKHERTREGGGMGPAALRGREGESIESVKDTLPVISEETLAKEIEAAVNGKVTIHL